MFKRLAIIFVAVFMVKIGMDKSVIAGPVGIIEDSKISLYAVVADSDNKGKKLYAKGDIFSYGRNPAEYFRILDIGKDRIMLEDGISKDNLIVKPGEAIPSKTSRMIFERTIESGVLEYSYSKSAEEPAKNQARDFIIKSLENNRIVLEKDYAALPAGKQLSDKEKEIFDAPKTRNSDKKALITGLFGKIESKKIGSDAWAVDRSSAEPAMRNAGAVIISAISRIEPQYRLAEGPGLRFNTSLGTAVVNREGFFIKSIAVAKLAESFGIRQGDVVKSINGYPVNNLIGIYRAYEDISSDKSAKIVSIDIARDGKAKTLVYKIR